MSKQFHWITPALLALLVLAGCRADDFDEGSVTNLNEEEDSVSGDTVVSIETGDSGDGDMVLYAAGDEELREVNQVSADDADELFTDVTIPNPSVVRARWMDAPNRGAIATDIKEGDTLAMWYLPHVSYLLGERDGWNRLDAAATDTLNSEVGDALAPEVDNLHAATGDLDEEPEAGSLGVNDPDLIGLYRMALGNLVMSDSDQQEDELEAFLNDAGSGVLDGRDRDGYPLDSVQYQSLSFNALYEMELTSLARDFGNDHLVETITDDGDSEGVETARFVSGDARCDDQFVSDYFEPNSQEDVELEAVEAKAEYGDLFTPGEKYSFSIEEDGTVTVTDDNDETLTVSRDKLFTCSQKAFDGSQERSLVRYVSDSLSGTASEQREELVMVGSGGEALAGEGDAGGIYIATESGDRLAVFGDVEPYKGYEPPDQNESSACGFDGYHYFAREGENVTATTDTTLGASIDNEELFVDDEPGTAASITTNVSLGGSAEAELRATADSTPMTDLENVLVLVSVPDDLLSLEVLDGVTITTFEDGEQQDEHSEVKLANTDLAGTLNDDNLRIIEFSTTKPFDSLQFTVDGGVLDLNTEIQAHEACYGADP